MQVLDHLAKLHEGGHLLEFMGFNFHPQVCVFDKAGTLCSVSRWTFSLRSYVVLETGDILDSTSVLGSQNPDKTECRFAPSVLHNENSKHIVVCV